MRPDSRRSVTQLYEKIVRDLVASPVQGQLLEALAKTNLEEAEAEYVAAKRNGVPVEQARAAIAQRIEVSGQLIAAARSFGEQKSKWQSSVKVFSDSIFVFFDDFDPDGKPKVTTADFIGVVGIYVSSVLWKAGIPHRGAVSVGDCYVDSAGAIFLGEPIVRAVRWAEVQEWLGVSVEPNSAPEIAAKAPELGFSRQEIPCASGTVASFALLPGCINNRAAPPDLPTRKEILDGVVGQLRAARQANLLKVLPRFEATLALLKTEGFEFSLDDELFGMP